MPNPALNWDQPTLTWDHPAARWDKSQPVPPNPPTPKKPFHRAARPPQTTPATPLNMPTFKYNVGPLANGGFTARAVRANQVDQAAITAEIATALSITPAQVEDVINLLFDKIMLSASGSDWSRDLYGCFSFRPTCGGNQASPGAFHTPDDINADIALTISAERVRHWRSTLSIQSLGEVGLITPSIESIIDITTHAVDRYTPANIIQLRGSDLRFKITDPAQGTFFRASTGPEVRATLYGQNEPGIVSVGIPSALTGPLQVRHAAFINGSIRSYTYTHAITAVD